MHAEPGAGGAGEAGRSDGSDARAARAGRPGSPRREGNPPSGVLREPARTRASRKSSTRPGEPGGPGEDEGRSTATASAHRLVVTTGDGARLDGEERGAGEPLLLIPGQGVSRRTWDLLLPELTRRFRVITYDHRGIGGSTLGEPAEWSTRLLAGDAAAVLDAAGVRRAHIVGHSMGARVAQWLALDRPERVASLVLISATGGDARGHPRPASATRALAGGDPAVLGPLFFGVGFRVRHPDVLGLLARGDAPLRARRGHFQASSTHDTWDELARIMAPTLVVHGADDEITPTANGRELAARIPGAEYLEVRGGHGIHLEDPTVCAAIVAFAARHTA